MLKAVKPLQNYEKKLQHQERHRTTLRTTEDRMDFVETYALELSAGKEKVSANDVINMAIDMLREAWEQRDKP